MEKIPTERSDRMKEIQYFYRKAHTVKQQLSFIDFMRCYEMVVNVTDAIQANHLWYILTAKINGCIFESFTEFNDTILGSIRNHIETYIGQNQQHKRQLSDYSDEEQPKKKQRIIPTTNVYITRPGKRMRLNSSVSTQ